MKAIGLFFICLFISCNETPKPKVAEVYLDASDTTNMYTTSERYRLKEDKCNIAWVVITSKDDESWGVSLRYVDYNPKSNECESFSSQSKTHQKILAYIFENFDTTKFTWVRTPSLKMLDPTGTWNEKIKELAAKNPEWIDYTKNYPNHKSGKSSNGLLEEELNKNLHIIKEFTELFRPKYNLEVSNVEKVFSEKRNGQSVFYDAGVYEYRVVK